MYRAFLMYTIALMHSILLCIPVNESLTSFILFSITEYICLREKRVNYIALVHYLKIVKCSS